MKLRLLLAAAALFAVCGGRSALAQGVEMLPAPPVAAAGAAAVGAYGGEGGAMYLNPLTYGAWHTGYYYTAWGRPVSLVVPPNATTQTDYGWGIGNTRVTPIRPQFLGPYNGYPYDGFPNFQPTPYWPSDTLQFGVYYIRAPW